RVQYGLGRDHGRAPDSGRCGRRLLRRVRPAALCFWRRRRDRHLRPGGSRPLSGDLESPDDQRSPDEFLVAGVEPAISRRPKGRPDACRYLDLRGPEVETGQMEVVGRRLSSVIPLTMFLAFRSVSAEIVND